MVELWGRRLLLLLGFATCLTACIVLTVALALQVKDAVTITHLKKAQRRHQNALVSHGGGDFLLGYFKPCVNPNLNSPLLSLFLPLVCSL